VTAGRERPGLTEHSLEVLDRLKQLEHAHLARAGRDRLRPGWRLALSLRFLRTALRHLVRRPRDRPCTPVEAPPPGALCATFIGHATVMLTTAQSRVLIDPCLGNFLWGLRRAEAACLSPVDAALTNLVLISHAHVDHLHLPSLRRLPRSATLLVPPGCGELVERLGFAQAVVLEPGADFRFRDLVVTSVATRHGGRRSPVDFRRRAACGYVVKGQGVTAYFSGDTGYFSGFRDIGRRMRPDLALLPVSGYEPLALRETHMSPLDAVAAFEDLEARILIPVAHGAFPLGYEPLEAPLEWLRQICRERGHQARLAVLAPGETCLVRR
jgi:L-ascorbate metabolism protein UlaG (beta-lactamase superfamily)